MARIPAILVGVFLLAPGLTSFGQDAGGELSVHSQEGRVYRIVPAS
jgi:hypothetical protein